MAQVMFERVTKTFKDEKRGYFNAVDNVSFTIEDREFVVFVGPSGCGKSTSLRMIAGLEKQTKGNISIGDTVVNQLQPKERDIAMVFQDYALYPHMTVYENLSFGLRNLREKKTAIAQKVKNAAHILGIEHLLDRKPRELSGGQRQRVAIGRAIVRNPKVFLFDEPLSNLDAKLRLQMRVELAELHKELQTTIIYVTHDQVEAMTLGQRIVVMNEGTIQQFATPDELYHRPSNLFVAGFIGAPSMNFVDCRVDRDKLVLADLSFPIPEKYRASCQAYDGQTVVLGIRPENMFDPQTVQQLKNEVSFDIEVKVVERLGNENLLYFDQFEQQFTARIDAESRLLAGDRAKIVMSTDKIHLFDKETGEALARDE